MGDADASNGKGSERRISERRKVDRKFGHPSLRRKCQLEIRL